MRVFCPDHADCSCGLQPKHGGRDGGAGGSNMSQKNSLIPKGQNKLSRLRLCISRTVGHAPWRSPGAGKSIFLSFQAYLKDAYHALD